MRRWRRGLPTDRLRLRPDLHEVVGVTVANRTSLAESGDRRTHCPKSKAPGKPLVRVRGRRGNSTRALPRATSYFLKMVAICGAIFSAERPMT